MEQTRLGLIAYEPHSPHMNVKYNEAMQCCVEFTLIRRQRALAFPFPFSSSFSLNQNISGLQTCIPRSTYNHTSPNLDSLRCNVS